MGSEDTDPHGLSNPENTVIEARATQPPETEERYLALVRGVGHIVWTAALDGHLAEAAEWCLYTGQRPEEIRNGEALSAIHPDDRERISESWRLSRLSETAFDAEYRLRRHDGVYRSFFARAVPVRAADGSIREWVGFAADRGAGWQAGAILNHRNEQPELVSDVDLGAGEEHFPPTIEQAAVGIAHVGLEGRWLRVNDRLCQIVGYSRAELLLRSFQDITHPEDLDDDLEQLRQLRIGEIATYSREKRYRRKNGSIVWVALTVSLVRDAHGAPAYYVSVVDDIDARKATEEALRESEERLQAVWAEAADAMALSDAAGKVLLINPAYGQLYGYTAEEVVGQDFAIIFPEAERARVQQQYAMVFANPEIPPVFESLVQRVDGTTRTVETRIAFLVRDGQRVALLSVIRDISERVQMERLIAEERDRLQKVLDELPEAVCLVDARGQVTLANRAAHEILGVDIAGRPMVGTQQEISIADDARRLDGTLYPAQETPLYRALHRGEAVRGDQQLVRHADSGREIPVLTNSVPLLADDGTISGAVAVFQDISSLKELERARDEFLSSVSHDLKTPLTSLRGMAQLLQRRAQRQGTPELDTLVEGLEGIIATTGTMTRLVDELLEVAQLQLGHQLKRKQQLVDLVALTRLVAARSAAPLGRSVVVESARQDIVVSVDPTPLERVLENLIGNALKYSPEGTPVYVRLTISRSEDTKSEPQLIIQVVDSGVGIPQSDMPHVFERFYRAGNVIGHIPGTGIGQASVRQIVEQHGGRVTVESAEKAGTTFTVHLPLGSVRDKGSV